MPRSLLDGSRFRAAGPHLLTFAAYAVVTAAWFFRLLPAVGSAYAHDAGDPALNTFILWWNARTVPFTADWWNAPSFFPLQGATAFTEILVGLNLIASPVVWLFHNPVLAYNAVSLLSFPLSAFGAYLLALELTGDRRAAFLAGLAFGFSPYRVAQLPHLQVITSCFMPLGLFALHRYLRLGQWRWLPLVGAAWLLQALSNGYFLLFFSVLLAAWSAWFLTPRAQWRKIPALGATMVLSALPLLPVAASYRELQGRFALVRQLREVLYYSGDLTSFLAPDPNVAVWGWLQRFSLPEGQLFPGVTICAVIALGLVLSLRGGERVRWSVLRLAVAAVSLVEGLTAVSVWSFGPWTLRIGSHRLASAGRAYKPFTVFLIGLAVLLLSHPRFVRSFKRRSAFAFYVLATLLIALASLGPEPTAFHERFFYRPPYALLMSLPGFDSLRVPTRFWTLGTLCLAAAGAFAFGRFVPRQPRRRTAVTVLVAAGLLADAWPIRMAVVPAAAPPACRAGAVQPVAYLQLPIGQVVWDVAAMNRAMALGLPSVNGYSGFSPPHYFALQYGVNALDPGVLAGLASRGPLMVAVDRQADRKGKQAAFVAGLPGVRELGGCGADLRVFVVPGTSSPPSTPVPAARPLHVASVRANINEEGLAGVTDGNLVTRWEVWQRLRRPLVADLGEIHRLDAVTLSLGPYFHDFPRALRIEASLDGETWQLIREGPTARETIEGALADPRRVPLRFPLNGISARFLRLTQYGKDATYSWSVAELGVTGQ